MLRPLYNWVIRFAGHPQAWLILAFISFLESSIFPIPPDILLIPMVIADRRNAFRLAALCTISSVIGGYAGYGIGYLAFETLGRKVIDLYHLQTAYDNLRVAFDHYGIWLILIKGMTPIPYKLLTITSGSLHFDLIKFTVASIASRSLRFFLVAALLWKFGEPIRDFIERRLTLVTSVFALLVVGGFVILAVS
ncbi:MAG: DedA family protein [Azospirillaceae bacterium]|nr:DedA family protein [Azospirillaceae bacterium]